jgi:acyl transferase domain-containing protein
MLVAQWAKLMRALPAGGEALAEPMLNEFERFAEGIAYRKPRVGVLSNVTGKPAADTEWPTAAYWRRHVCDAVRFQDGMKEFQESDSEIFVELGSATIASANARQMTESLARLYVSGADVRWTAYERGRGARKISLPTYPFQRERYWVEEARGEGPRGSGAGGEVHPLVGERLRSALRDVQYESAIGMAKLPYLSDHRVYGQAVFPAAGYLEMALAAAEDALGAGPHELKEMAIAHPLVLGAEGRSIKTIQTIVRQGESGATFEILSAPEGGEGNWLLHVSGGIRSAESAPALRIDAARARCVEAVDVEGLYAGLRSNGLDYGPGFRSIESAWRGEGEAVAHLRLAVDGESYGVHPALLDGALQVLAAVNYGKEGATYLPVAVEAFRLFQRKCPT